MQGKDKESSLAKLRATKLKKKSFHIVAPVSLKNLPNNFAIKFSNTASKIPLDAVVYFEKHTSKMYEKWP